MKKDLVLQRIADTIPKYLKGYDIENIRITETVKNNGIKYSGICIKIKDCIFAPNMYIERYVDDRRLFDISEDGTEADNMDDYIVDISKKMAEDFKVSLYGIRTEDVCFPNINDIEDRLFLTLVNYEKNKDTLEACPHICFNDLAVTFRWLAFQKNGYISSVLVNDSLKTGWQLSTDEMFRIALKNTMNRFPAVIKRLDDVIADITGIRSNCESPFYVMTNTNGINGATVIIYKRILEDFAEKINSNLYIIPSSIHEVILFSSDFDISADEVREITMDVNRNVVGKEEVLSDSLYYYNRVKKSITVVA